MTCEAYENGKCKHYKGAECPVIQPYRDLVDMKACAVVAQKLGINQYTGEKVQ